MTRDHLMHSRKADGISVDLYWNPDDLENEFQVNVKDERTGSDFILYPLTGIEAIHAFHHPFAAAREALAAGRVAA